MAMTNKIKGNLRVMSPIIETKALQKEVYAPDPILILESIDLKINANETVAIQGESGSGKTTLLTLLAGLDTPSSGEVYFNGHPFHTMSEEARAQVRLENIGFIFQNFDLMPHFSALENVMLPLQLKSVQRAKEIATELLEKVGLGERLRHTPKVLSGGEQQRVAIARAYATSPKVLFADEPTGSLDSKNGEMITSLLFKLNQEQGTTLVFVTHSEALANQCDKTIHLKAGKLQD